jgi:hypothetical protein
MHVNLSFWLQHFGSGVSSSFTAGYNIFIRSIESWTLQISDSVELDPLIAAIFIFYLKHYRPHSFYFKVMNTILQLYSVSFWNDWSIDVNSFMILQHTAFKIQYSNTAISSFTAGYNIFIRSIESWTLQISDSVELDPLIAAIFLSC